MKSSDSIKSGIRLKFVLPKKVSSNSIYSGQHWAARKKLADLYHDYMMPFRKLKVTAYPADISYTFTFKGRLLDTTNCFLMAKLIEDGMVRNGILEGDSPLYVGSTTIRVNRGLQDEVEIIIT